PSAPRAPPGRDRGSRQRPRDRARGFPGDLRAVLLDQVAGARERARSVHLLPDRARPQGRHRGGERAGPGQHLPGGVARRGQRLMAEPAILIADDDPVALELLAEVLTGEGYRVRTAPGGADCLERARSEPFDLAIVDLRMPG